jgi:hypothetical protein
LAFQGLHSGEFCIIERLYALRIVNSSTVEKKPGIKKWQRKATTPRQRQAPLNINRVNQRANQGRGQ